MKKFYTAICTLTTLIIGVSFAGCEKKPAPPKPAEQPVKQQEYKSSPKKEAQSTQQSNQAGASYNK